MPQVGCNVVGFVSSEFGLGIAARNTVHALTAAGIPVSVYDIPLKGRSGANSVFSPLQRDFSLPPRYDITLYHVNVPQVPQINSLLHPDFTHGVFKALVPFWELPRIPDSWLPIIDEFNAVGAPSSFIRHAFAGSSGTPVLPYPQAVLLPEQVLPDRQRFGLPADRFLFVTSFDIGSDLLRKNPLGAIDAFCNAFSDRFDAGLVIKVNKTVSGPPYDQMLEKLRRVTNAHPGIQVLDSPMSYEDVTALYASCDCFVSLHRAEGLGLGIMEAMALGKPVIATYWSAPTDYMTPGNSCMVSSTVVPCDPSLNPSIAPEQLGFQGVWAEPSLADAIAWMRELVRNPELCGTIGSQAQKSMAACKTRFLEGTLFSDLHTMYTGIPRHTVSGEYHA